MGESLFDAIIIGSGQGGVPLARAFAKAGKKTALIERAAIGGTCINYGCTPTKTLVHIGKVADTVRRGPEYGVHAGPARIDMLKVRELKRQIVAEFRDGTEEGLRAIEGLELIFGNASFVSPHELEVRLCEGGVRTVTSETIVISVGTRAFIPPIPGLDSVPYLDNVSVMELDHVPASLTILGAGYIGLEFGQLYCRLGSKVTILENGSMFLPHEDRDVAEAVLKVLNEDGIDVRLGVNAQQARQTSGQIELDLGGSTIAGDALLVAVGRTSNTDDLGLDKAGLKADARGYIKVDSRLRTGVEGLYAIGDVKGGPAFTHIAYDDYRILRDNILEGQDRTIDNRLVPYVAFIDPELAHIGLYEDEAKKQGVPHKVLTMKMTHVARALEMNESRGFIKALVDGDGKILGATVFGVEGGEIMAMFQLAMMGGITGKQLYNTVFAHPTLSELLNNLFSG